MFKQFSQAVHGQYTAMAFSNELYTVDISPDDLWAAYLAAFPEGTDPVFRVNTEHTCSCCRNFIKNIGNVVAIVDGQLVSVWDAPHISYPYSAVAIALELLIKSRPINALFRKSERQYGAEQTTEPGPPTLTWNHFHGRIADRHYTQDVGAKVGDYATGVAMFERACKELTTEAFETVIDLAESNNLYKGAEFLPSVHKLAELHRQYRTLAEGQRNTFLWAQAADPVVRLRNSAIGTLLVDLSEGVDLERAVKSYEDKVSGTNYKRPTALITPGMIKSAMATITELGLEPALERRMANIHDITMNNVIWADNSVKPLMKGGLEDVLMSAAASSAPALPKDAEAISMADFIANILPQAKSLDIYVKNSQQANFMTLTAPVHADVPQLFKWPNNFAWSYSGEVADSIKERVKAAGGTVEGDLCCRLAWDYTDDLDFHMFEPGGGHIQFGNRRRLSSCGGMLDLDANGADGQREDPSENIFYADRRKMRNGVYTLKVNNYNRRSSGKGFEVQIEFDGQIHHIVHPLVVSQSATIEVAKIEYKDGVFKILESLPSSQSQRDVWGVKTETMVKVNTVLFSPNYWDDNAVGNKHVFFIMDGCKNTLPVRGIYNEFLSSDLDKHRKVFETVGDRTKCPVADEQLSGVGFSSTRGDKVTVQVSGAKFRKTLNINF